MNGMPHQCGSLMGGDPIELCGPLAQLKREHGPLREQMDAFAALAAEIRRSAGGADTAERLEQLRTKVKEFADRLDPHSEREEGALFPMVAKYIGRETGPIAVMEAEHEQAKRNLRRFFEAFEGADASAAAAQAGEIAAFAVTAHEILTDHFLKEENVLFPMAERLLSAEEKEQLAREMQ